MPTDVLWKNFSAKPSRGKVKSFLRHGRLLPLMRSQKQEQRGAANGISLTSMSLLKAVGPGCNASVSNSAGSNLPTRHSP